MKRLIFIFAAILLPYFSMAQGGQFKKIGDYEVHYMAFNTTDLSEDTAKKVGIKRSKKIGLFNVSVVHNPNNDMGTPVEPKSIKLFVKNLMTQNVPVDLTLHKELPAVYYIGQFKKSHKDTLWFTVEVQLPNSDIVESFKFAQQVWVE